MRIAISQHPYLETLVARAQELCSERGWQLHVVPETQAASMLINRLADLALISPLGYGSAVSVADLRIVPETCMLMQDFTHVIGITIREGAEEIETMVSHQPMDFLPVVGGLLMSEKYGAVAAPLQDLSKGAQVDCIIDPVSDATQAFHLDLGEEWFDAIEQPLLCAMWACHADIDADEATMREVVRSCATPTLSPIEVHEDYTMSIDDVDDVVERDGRITWEWSVEAEESLESVLNLLYFHQRITAIPAVKILGQENDGEMTDELLSRWQSMMEKDEDTDDRE